MDVNAHLQVEMVLNEDENEEEKRFNEIICYDSGGDSSHENDYVEHSVICTKNLIIEKGRESVIVVTVINKLCDAGCVDAKSLTLFQWGVSRVLSDYLGATDEYFCQALKSFFVKPSGTFNHDIVSQNPVYNSKNLSNAERIIQKKSNAAQMRKYRARQRSDPIRYQQYLARERMRNYKRKYEKRVKDAQDRAIEMGIPYIVLEPFYSQARRGRRPKFPSDDVSLVLPAKFEDDYECDSNSFEGIPIVPVKVELLESDETYQEKPKKSIVNINQSISHPRSALQTLLPQEVHDRERVSNFIKLDHDYVKKRSDRQDNISLQSHLNEILKHENPIEREKRFDRKKRHRSHKDELLKLQEQCRSYILQQALSGEAPIRRKRSSNMSKMRKTRSEISRDCVEHEDLDDLFKELAEVANKEPQKKKQSSKTSPRKDDGQFSLTVSMPVQPIKGPKRQTINIKTENLEENEVPRSNNIFANDMQMTEKPMIKIEEPFSCNEDSIEIKQEPISSDDDFP